MIVYESYDIPRYFFGQIPCFCSVSFACDVVFAFRNFVRWRTKFSCLLSFRIASRQYWQIFRHRQTIGDISNIADTYLKYFFESSNKVEWLDNLSRLLKSWVIRLAQCFLSSRVWTFFMFVSTLSLSCFDNEKLRLLNSKPLLKTLRQLFLVKNVIRSSAEIIGKRKLF
jgi:hypothetical protein